MQGKKNLRNLIHILMIVLLSTTIFAQPGGKLTTKSKKAIKFYENATRHYDNYNNLGCIEEVNKAIAEDPKFIEAYYLLASTYSDLKQTQDAISVYEKAISIDEEFYPGAFYLVASLQLSIGKYENAGNNFQKFLKFKGESPIKQKGAIKGLEVVQFAIEQLNNPVPFEMINMGKNINSENDEYLPAITADEQTLIITVRRPKDEQTVSQATKLEEDFYFSNKINGEWNKAEPVGPPLNTHGNEGAQCISPDGQYIYYTACNRAEGRGSCDIYFSRKIGNTWSTPENLGEPINTSSWESQPSISSDGKTLYFASSREGGKGNIDIWKSILDESGKFGVPINLGDSINTRYNEMSPFLHPDNQTLYFSSDGMLGMGGKDIYYSRKNKDGEWTKPINIGYPINTFADEINLLVNAKGDLAYFSSDKPGGFGKYDLYSFELYQKARPQMVSYMKGKVYDAETLRKLDAKFELLNLETGEIVAQSKANPVSGEFLVCLPVGKSYALNVSKDGYLFYSENIALEGIHSEIKPFIKDVPLKPIKVGEIVVLRNIFFETDKFELKNESKVELNKLIDLLKLNKSLKIEISGHTDNVGNEKYNLTLSENRAKTVYEYLSNNGILKTRLTFKGYGWSKPIENNDTENGRANNRRTEFKVISN
jgi:outer membrane protein OmpA-like peptidoglycan-associated protein